MCGLNSFNSSQIELDTSEPAEYLPCSKFKCGIILHTGKSSQRAPDVVPRRHSLPTSLRPLIHVLRHNGSKKLTSSRLQGQRTCLSCAIRTLYALCHRDRPGCACGLGQLKQGKCQLYSWWECWDPALSPQVVWQAELNLRTVKTVQPTHSGEQIQETCREMELEPWRHHVFSINPYPKSAYFWAFQLHESIVSLVFSPIWIGFSVAVTECILLTKKVL